MKIKLTVVAAILTTTLLVGCSNSNPGTLTVRTLKNISKKSAPFLDYLKGNRQYVKDIEKVEAEYGYKAALEMLMRDVHTYHDEFDNSSYDSIVRVYRLTSYLIGKIGDVDIKTHYFRNELNRAPESLKELLILNSCLPLKERWSLVPVNNSLYHMQGKNGEYNLKFITADGFCEAVYNKDGILLTEKNDPVNMGTFNYAAGIFEKDSHTKYDVEPFFQWGNAENSPQKGKADITKGKNQAYQSYTKNADKVDHYRNNIMWQFNMETLWCYR